MATGGEWWQSVPAGTGQSKHATVKVFTVTKPAETPTKHMRPR